MGTLRDNALKAQLNMLPGLADSDLLLHKRVLHTKIRWAVPQQQRASIDYNMLRARGYGTIGEVIKGTIGSTALLARIALPELRDIVLFLDNEYRDWPLPDADGTTTYIYDRDAAHWLNVSTVGSSTIRKFLYKNCAFYKVNNLT